jgi:hypothetical protein
VRRRANLGALAGTVVLLGVLAISAVVVAESFAAKPKPKPKPAPIQLDQKKRGILVLSTRTYRLILSKRNGAILDLFDYATKRHLVTSTNGCEWGVAAVDDPAYIGGCTYTPTSGARFSYRWSAAAKTLTFTYAAGAGAPRAVDATVALRAGLRSFDLRLTLANRGQHPIQTVNFPVDLYADVGLAQAGYAPNFLPGVHFGPGFFSRVGNNVLTYPSRWAFADYLALDLGGAHMAMYTVNPATSPLQPESFGFVHNAPPIPCSGKSFCITHQFQTWIRPGTPWTSPLVRVRIGDTVDKTILAYRADNGIGGYPSAAAKLGSRLGTLARAPLLKADLGKGVAPFRDWPAAFGQLPSPLLVHPVGFGPGGFDASDPDLLPPDARYGTLDDLRAAFRSAQSHGDLVMPYLNVSWWNPQSPTIHELPPPLTSTAISVLDQNGNPMTEQFSGFDGYIASPAVPYVRDRVRAEIDRWGADAPADCRFFDQIGARPWKPDFNPAESSPTAYDDAWLSLFAPYGDRCLMVEDGWDRLAQSFSGFQGGLLLMEREHHEPDKLWGAGNWRPFPLALWLLHDKVLLYQHDLYEKTMTIDPEVLTWNEAFGFVSSYDWGNGSGSAWLPIAAAFQKALGPHYAGVALTSYRDIAAGVTETRFGSYTVVANWNGSAYTTGGYRIAPGGFLARTDDGGLVAGEFADASGPIYRITESGKVTFTAAVPAPG